MVDLVVDEGSERSAGEVSSKVAISVIILGGDGRRGWGIRLG